MIHLQKMVSVIHLTTIIDDQSYTLRLVTEYDTPSKDGKTPQAFMMHLQKVVIHLKPYIIEDNAPSALYHRRWYTSDFRLVS